MNQNKTKTESFHQKQSSSETNHWQQLAGFLVGANQNEAANETPKSQPEEADPQQQIRRRIGAVALTLSIGIGTAVAGPKMVNFIKEQHPYSVDGRTPTEEEVCTVRQAGNRALLVVASEFTNDLSSRGAAASRIREAIRDQNDDLFGICYSPSQDYTRVLTDEAIENLPREQLTTWLDFPGRTNDQS